MEKLETLCATLVTETQETDMEKLETLCATLVTEIQETDMEKLETLCATLAELTKQREMDPMKIGSDDTDIVCTRKAAEVAVLQAILEAVSRRQVFGALRLDPANYDDLQKLFSLGIDPSTLTGPVDIPIADAGKPDKHCIEVPICVTHDEALPVGFVRIRKDALPATNKWMLSPGVVVEERDEDGVITKYRLAEFGLYEEV